MELKVNNTTYNLSNNQLLDLITLDEHKINLFNTLYNITPIQNHNTSDDLYMLNLIKIKNDIKQGLSHIMRNNDML